VLPVTGTDLGFSAYRQVARLFGLITPAFLAWRQAKGKEHPERWPERKGIAGVQRPAGKLAWLHGASVGESVTLLPLVPSFVERGFQVLVTSGTLTSSRIVESRLPAGAIHQFVPLDVPKFARRFIAHWRPELVVFVESELWPNLMYEAAGAGARLALVNARMSERSARRWHKVPRFIAGVLRRLDLCLAQSQTDGERFASLGADQVYITGNLKYDVPPPAVDREELAEMAARIGSRPVWVAASTHEGEEEIAIAVHRQLSERFPTLLTILAPRHPERGTKITSHARQQGFEVAQRSHGESPATTTQVYVADTIGDLGLLYRLTSVVFMGKSLVAGGGQNPIEAAKLGCAVLHGPMVHNFAEAYEALDEAEAAMEVFDLDELAETLAELLADSARLRRMARTAAETMEKLAGATQRTMYAIDKLIAAACL
jgi:3-deoxy-D-manno-octulosonic-acid transferase